MSDGIARFKDFTGDGGKIQFAISGETFTALDDIPLAYMGKLAEIGEGIAGDGGTDKIIQIFKALLEPESFTRFEAAVRGESSVVVGISRVKEIIPWLLEMYGLRPTEASSGSGITSSESGASSTDGLLLAEMTS